MTMTIYNGEHTTRHQGNTMINTLITIAMLAAILVPVIMIGVADIKRHPIQWRKDHEDSDYMKAVKGGSKALAEYHRQTLMGK